MSLNLYKHSMIYIIVSIYILFLIIIYDFKTKTKSRTTHLIVVLILMILISGLRYRLGTDTIIYMDGFSEYPDIFRLKFNDFSQFRYQPLWIILNSLGRTLGSFVYVQLITSALHIGILGYVLNKICPSLTFSSLFVYFLFDYLILNMEVMRESIAIAFFLLAILAIDQKRMLKSFIYITIATLFHVFAFPIYIIFIFYYKVISQHQTLEISIIILIIFLCVSNKDFMSNSLLAITTGDENSVYMQTAFTYANSEMYGTKEAGIFGTISALLKVLLYTYGLHLCKPLYHKYVRLKWKLFSATCWFSAILAICYYSMPIMHRPYQYFTIFQWILFILFFVHIAYKLRYVYRAPIYMACLGIVTVLAIHKYMKPDQLTQSERTFSIYYPYSSIFDRKLDDHRERIYLYKY